MRVQAQLSISGVESAYIFLERLNLAERVTIDF
jgi:hypothetical protein